MKTIKIKTKFVESSLTVNRFPSVLRLVDDIIESVALR
jgi:hypothetical protein